MIREQFRRFLLFCAWALMLCTALLPTGCSSFRQGGAIDFENDKIGYSDFPDFG